MHRVRSLTLDNLSNEVASLLALPAPQLEELELPFGLEGRYMIPTPFLANNAPCLKRLTVAESIDFPWDSPVLDHLVELTIDRSTSQMRACAFPAPNAFFNLIGRLDRIQVLRLRNCLPIMPHVTLDPRIALPTLKHFELEGTSEQCSNVLERIEFDLQARFFLTCREHHFGHERMFNELYRHFRGDSRMLPVRTLAVSYSSEQVHHLDDRAVLAFRAWNTSCVDKEEEEKEKEKDLGNAAEPDFYQDLEGAETKLPDVRMTFAMKTWFVEQESYRLCALVPYDALRVLSMDVRGTRLNPESIRRVSWPLEHVLDMFWSVPKLAHLRLGGNGDVDSRQAAQFFRGMRERGTDEPARLEMFPDLKTLTLVDVSTCFSCHGEALFDILQHMLRLRKLDDMPIGTVYVKERRYEDQEWAKWKELEDTKVVFRREVKFVEEGCKWVQF
ncbi:hypothetical protein OF83DRAFT_1180507 [Amylostereum chailletii]|nr:hypothetical protein OF83DRAFT_1180507 [Amylostereum chailletii]